MHWRHGFPVRLSGYVVQTILLIDHQLMGIVIQMNGGGVDSDVLVIAEELGHLFQWNPLGFWNHEEGPDRTNAADDDK
jgi:hypothetical protein